MVMTIVGAFALDLAIPSYPIAGFYLVPVTLAALTSRVRFALAVSGVCLGLAVVVMTVQGRTDGPTVTVVCFSVLGGAGLIALAYLFKRVDRLYQAERSTTLRLRGMSERLRLLQEVAVLDGDRPLADLLSHIVDQARQVLGGDGCCIYLLAPAGDALRLNARAGWPTALPDEVALGESGSPVSRAARTLIPVTASSAGHSARRAPDPPDGNGADGGRPALETGSTLAVPLVVKDRSHGVLALRYDVPRSFSDVDLQLAVSFAGQAALIVENARLRGDIERNAVAAERTRLAHDLHDSVTQSLFAASLKAEALRRRWRPSNDDACRTVEDLERLTRGALAEMRGLLMEMNPSALAESSLTHLLKHLAAETEVHTATAVSLSVSGRRRLPPDLAIGLYRIAQEALRNVVHHAHATSAWVKLELPADRVRLVVGDDGRGFMPSRVPPGHFGLRVMRERAETIGARLTIASERGHGTVVTAEWPTPEDIDKGT